MDGENSLETAIKTAEEQLRTTDQDIRQVEAFRQYAMSKAVGPYGINEPWADLAGAAHDVIQQLVSQRTHQQENVRAMRKDWADARRRAAEEEAWRIEHGETMVTPNVFNGASMECSTDAADRYFGRAQGAVR